MRKWPEEIVIEIMIACLLFKIEFSGLKEAKDYLFSEVKEYSQTYIKETTELQAELLLLLKCSVLSDYRFTLSEIARHKNREKEDFFCMVFFDGLSFEEVAEEKKCRRKTVRKYYNSVVDFLDYNLHGIG